ncbi:hypothetical protein [Mycolicibacterium holsaticum]|uniref:Uncharacterized protein n=1 Tax=Mycolicibacterium holsaticum TaxID=152142 RepID=A0A1E3S0B1_9MYCO|nr:hypothetical protein [Mycolicibacterium holsaticum]ODQ95548.1 hypothetical protein BHQ17_04495 [Mycolicibacterium holsaticum]
MNWRATGLQADARFALRDFFESHLREEFSRSPQGLRILNTVLPVGAVKRRYRRKDLLDNNMRSAVLDECAMTERLAMEALSEVNPRTVLALGAIRKAVHASQHRDFLFDYGHSRIVWLIGAAGGGKGPLGYGVINFLECMVHWLAAERLAALLRPSRSTAFSHLEMALRASSAQMANLRTRMWWSSLIVSRSLLRHALLETLPESAISELVQYIVTCDTNCTIERPEFILPPLSEGARSFAEACAIPAGAYAGVRISDVFNTRLDGEKTGGQAFDAYPFILVDDQVVPVNIPIVRGSLHTTIADYLRRSLPEKAVTRVMERTAGDTLGLLFHNPSDHVLTDVTIKVSDSDKGQVDFAVRSDPTLILGEVKAGFEPADPSKTVSSYERDVGKAFQQLTLRLAAAAQGTPVVVGGRRIKPGTFAAVRGLGVVMHDFGGGIWGDVVLSGKYRQATRFPIMTLQDLALVAYTLDGMDEFLRYLDFRHDVVGAGHSFAAEEFDILAAFLEGADIYVEQFAELRRRKRTRILLRPRDVPLSLQHTFAPPQRSAWRQMIAGMPKLRLETETSDPQ